MDLGETVGNFLFSATFPNKRKRLVNVVDVVERLRDPTDQVPNARHLHDLHTFISVTALVLLT